MNEQEWTPPLVDVWKQMTYIPERIFALCYQGSYTSGQWVSDQSDGAARAVEYIRADLVAAKDAEIDRLRELLRGRDGYNHDVWCSFSADVSDPPCYFGHNAVAAYFREIEG